MSIKFRFVAYKVSRVSGPRLVLQVKAFLEPGILENDALQSDCFIAMFVSEIILLSFALFTALIRLSSRCEYLTAFRLSSSSQRSSQALFSSPFTKRSFHPLSHPDPYRSRLSLGLALARCLKLKLMRPLTL